MVKRLVYIISLLIAALLLSTAAISIASADEKEKFSEKTSEIPASKLSVATVFLPASTDSYEPDDNSTLAQWIFTNATVQEHTFDPIGESDWVKFTCTENKTYVIQTQNTSIVADTYIRLFDSDGTTILGYNDDINNSNLLACSTPGINCSSQIFWFCKTSGTYYIQIIESPYSYYPIGGSYNITVNETDYNKTVSGGDAYESDNMYPLAPSIFTNRTYYHHNFTYFTNDEDYMNFNVTENQIYVIETFNTTSSTDTYLKLYSNDGTTLVSSNDDIRYPYNYNSRIIFKPTENTSYYVAAWDRYTRGGNYSIDVYNATATQVYTNGTSLNLPVAVKGGAEFVKFTAVNGTTYTIKSFGSNSTVDTYLYLYDENLTLLRENDDNSNSSTFGSNIVWYASESYNNTTMYVMISDSYRNYSNFNVTITTTDTSIGQPFEQDSASSLAKWINTTGVAQNHTFYPVGEEDWVKFNATDGTTYTIKTLNSTKTDTYIKLYFENKTLVTFNDDISYPSDRNSRIVWNCTDDGIYFLQIIDQYNYGGNYSISVENKTYVSVAITSPVANIKVTQNGTFEVTANITCSSVNCGNITAILDPEEKEKVSDTKVEEIAPKESNAMTDSYEPELVPTETQTYIVLLKDPFSILSDSLEEKRESIKENQDKFIKTLPAGVEITAQYSIINGLALELTPDEYSTLKANPDVLSIQEPVVYNILLNESNPMIRANDSWQIQTPQGVNVTGAGQTVCIIDTGVNYSHPALNHSYIGGYDFCNGTTSCNTGTKANDTNPMDGQGHGTHVAGIIVSNNTTYPGIAPNASFVAMKIFPDVSGPTSTTQLIYAIERCIANKTAYNISVISMSIGSDAVYNNITSCESADNALTSAINTATTNGLIVVAAAGNKGLSTGISLPSCISNVISVGSVTKDDAISSFSNSGTLLDLLAPGSSIYSTSLRNGTICTSGGDFAYCSGTSMATPHVAGAILLLNQYHKAQTGYSLTKTSALYYLKNSGVQKNDSRNGLTFPRIDIYEALLYTNNSKGGAVPMNSGNPFFTTSQNPRNATHTSCLKNMRSGDSCELTWIVNATGEVNKTWEFYVEVSSNYYDIANTNQSNIVNITITSENMAPQINITTPSNNAQLNASNFWVNATIYSNTSLVSSAQLRWENSTKNNTWFNLTRLGNTTTWYYNFNSTGIAEGNYTLRISANNSLKSNNQTTLNITIDNQLPRINITSTYPQYTSTPWLNYTVTDSTRNTTWYILNNGPAVMTNDTGDSPISTILGLIHPGLQNLTVYANDSFGNTNSTAKAFYEFFPLNMSNWTGQLKELDPEVDMINVTNSTGDISSEESVNITSMALNMTIQTAEFNITIMNFQAKNATWSMYPSFNLSETNTALKSAVESYGSNLSKSISFYNMSHFLSNGLYSAAITFEGNNTTFTELRYCDTDNVTSINNCTKLTTSGTNNYSILGETTTVYVQHLSSIAVLNDSSVPTITFNSPRNTSAYTANSETYNVSINITTSGDVVSCNYSIDGATNHSLSKISGTDYYTGYTSPVLANGNYNVTVYCTDSFNKNSSTNYFTISDATDPVISTNESSISETSADIDVTSDEPVYGVAFFSKSTSPVRIDVNSSLCDSWKDNTTRWNDWVDDCSTSEACDYDVITKSHITKTPGFGFSGLSADTEYYYGVCACDYNNNCYLKNSGLAFVTTATNSSNDEDNSPGAGGKNETANTTVSKLISLWYNVLPNTDINWIISSASIPITNIRFQLSEAFSTVTLELTNLQTDYSSTGLPPAPNNAHSYFKLTTSAYGKVSTAEFTFKIPKSWFTENNYDSKKVRIYRGVGDNWEALVTSVVETDGSEYTYKATTPGFSFFAITAPSLPPQITPNTTVGENYAGNANGTTITSETPNLSCGNGVCNLTETCLTCPEDCGECKIIGTTFFLGLGSFIKAYWIPLAIGGIIVAAAAVFFVLTSKDTGLFGMLMPKRKSPSEKPASPKSNKAFEIPGQKKTKQVTLTQEKPKQQQPEQPQKSFSIFSKSNTKKNVIEELKKQPGVFKLR